MKNNVLAKTFIGFITYNDNTAKYLAYFLLSLKNQTYKNIEIIAIDNSEKEENQNREFIKKNYPEINLKWAGKNIGFAKAFNLMITQAVADGGEYFLALNPDMILDQNMIAYLVEALERQPELGSVSPKLLKWDYKNNVKTKIIDTLGLKLLPGLRFVDFGQGLEDKSQLNEASILGPSGAAAFYRIRSLEKVRQNGNYFDEFMFMYKEDCDLAYRLFLAGFKSRCVYEAVAFHDRTVIGLGQGDLTVALNRKNKSRQAKQWSFLNQQIIFIKYWRRQNWLNKLTIIWFEFKMLIFVIFFEPYLMKQLFKVNEIKNEIKKY